MNENLGLMGRKIGMTQIFDDDGNVVPVTVVDVSGNIIIRIKTDDTKDGYNALQLGFGSKKEKHTSKPMKGVFNASNTEIKRHIREIRVSKADASRFNAGDVLAPADIFSANDKIDVTGTSKGRGFAGVMKRYNFKGFIRSHGTHEYFRHGGSIGTRLTPGHVIKGKRMPGHMGAERVTMQNLKIVKIDSERNLVYVKGGIPGANRNLVVIRKAIK
jgi:large subunit ribosomal protein L3